MTIYSQTFHKINGPPWDHIEVSSEEMCLHLLVNIVPNVIQISYFINYSDSLCVSLLVMDTLGGVFRCIFRRGIPSLHSRRNREAPFFSCILALLPLSCLCLLCSLRCPHMGDQNLCTSVLVYSVKPITHDTCTGFH